MMIEERTRFEVLLENLQTSVNVIAEGHVVLVERLDRIDGRFDKLEAKVDRLEVRFEVFASDAQQRLKRIETHLALSGSKGSSPRRKATSVALPKHHKKA